MGQTLGGTLGLIIIIFGFVIAVLWIMLPFAVFGIKNRLDQIIETNKTLNKYLPSIAYNLTTLAEATEKPAANDDHVPN